MKGKLFIFFILFAGCEKNSSNGVILRTHSDFYRSGWIYISIQNHTHQSITMERCGGTIFNLRDKQLNSAWVLASIYQCGNNALIPEIIPSNTTLEDSIFVSKTGTFRFRIPFLTDGESPKTDTVNSNAFTIY